MHCYYSRNEEDEADHCTAGTSDVKYDKESNEKLIFTGDAIEYKDLHTRQKVNRNTVTAIQRSKGRSPVVLKNGAILHGKKFMVWKVKLYCTHTRRLIPNPFAKGFLLDKCMLERGTLMLREYDEPDPRDNDPKDTSEHVSVPRRPRKDGKSTACK